MRMHCVPGNHDIRDLMRPICSRPPFSYCAKEEIRDWLLLGLDSCITGDAGGEIADEEFDRLDRSLSTSARKAHHGLPAPSARADGQRLAGHRALRMATNYCERLHALAGSAWLYSVTCTNPTMRSTMAYRSSVHRQPAASSSRQVTISRSMTATRLPPHYLDGDGSIENELIWVDE